MGKNSTFLLDDGDELQLSETVTLIYRPFGDVKRSVLTSTQEREKTDLSSRYLVTGRLLGEGGYGKVLISIDQTTQRQLACKIVNLEKLYDRRADLCVPTSDGQWSSSQAISQLPASIQSCFREFDILKDLSHPNIIQIQKVFWSRSTIYMFQELVTGGDLFSYIEYKHGKISSIESAVIIRQVLKGVQHLHDQDIVHRDLKPDNILMTSLDSGARVVITDFGYARYLPNASIQHESRSNRLKRMFSLVGTLEYTAPEVHKMNRAIPHDYGYSLSVDMWSIGSITAAVLTGEQLFGCRRDSTFEKDSRREIIGLAAQCDLSVLDDEYHPSWGPIGPAPKDFIKRLLVLREEDRMTAAEALNHIWFTHPMMAGEFEAEYERSTRDWRPRHRDGQLVERIPALKPDQAKRKASESKLANGAASRFLSCKAAPNRDVPTDEYLHIYASNHQSASQPKCSSYYSGYAGNHARERGQMGSHSQLDKHCDTTLDWSGQEQQTYADPVADDQQIPQLKNCAPPTEKGTGQLQRVSTSTRGKYFEREIVDLDDLEGPGDAAVDAGELNGERADHEFLWGSLRREGTIQVHTTPSADSEAHYDVNLWWHHRYPHTQFHYDTQAKPITQEDSSVLVQETPPEVFAAPAWHGATDVSRNSYDFGQHRGMRQANEAPSTRDVKKRRKVYGRRH